MQNKPMNSNSLNTSSSKWSGGYEGVGERFFGYRNAIARPILWGEIIALVAVQFAPIRALLGYDEFYVFDALTAFWIIFPAAVLAWSWWRYCTAGITVSDLGIREKTAFGMRTVLWTNVISYGIDDKGSGTVRRCAVRGRNGEYIRFWTAISDTYDLMDIITARARWAQGSWQRTDYIYF